MPLLVGLHLFQRGQVHGSLVKRSWPHPALRFSEAYVGHSRLVTSSVTGVLWRRLAPECWACRTRSNTCCGQAGLSQSSSAMLFHSTRCGETSASHRLCATWGCICGIQLYTPSRSLNLQRQRRSRRRVCSCITRAVVTAAKHAMLQLVQSGNEQPPSQRVPVMRRQLCILHEDKGKRFNRCGLRDAWFGTAAAALPSGA